MSTMRHWGIACLLVAAACGPSAARAATAEAATEQVRARLVASVDAVRPGERFWLGVQQRIIPHWHTYWINPGDSGQATSIDWTLPPGASAGPIRWPVPQRFMLGPIVNHGYADEVTLLAEVRAPDTLPADGRFPVRAAVEWLVCETECIPQQVELAMTLPVAAPGAAVARAEPAIQQALARLPVPSPWPVRLEAGTDGRLALRVDGAALRDPTVTEVRFLPAQWGRVDHAAPQPLQPDGDGVSIALKAGEQPPKPGESLAGVLLVSQRSGEAVVTRGFAVDAAPSAAGGDGLLAALGLALLGGLVLNLMPCVFPVLAIKALGLLQQSRQSTRAVRLGGLAYTAGVLASFAVLAGLLVAVKAAGAQVGWGFQFQSPLFVVAVAYLMFAVGLSLSGLFEVGTRVAGVGSSLAERPGLAGAFFTGVLATLVATPCTAPFMGVALGWALVQPPLPLLAVFLALGLGLALPYLALSWWPALSRRLPAPGPWMVRLKQAFAFPMYATAAWLLWVLAQQAGPDAVGFALAGLVVLGFAAWLHGATRGSRVGAVAAIAGVVLALGLGHAGTQLAPSGAVQSAQAAQNAGPWQPYTPQRLQALRAEGKPVFVNLTAAWCITCLANERVALSTDAVQQAFAREGIAALKGDWTRQDPQVSALLAEFRRSGVPLYLFYPPGAHAAPVVLPQILTPDIVLQAVSSTVRPQE